MLFLYIWCEGITLSQLKNTENKVELVKGVLDGVVDEEMEEYVEDSEGIKEGARKQIRQLKRDAEGKFVTLFERMENEEDLRTRRGKYEEAEDRFKEKQGKYEDEIIRLKTEFDLNSSDRESLMRERQVLQQQSHSSSMTFNQQQIQSDLREKNRKIQELSKILADIKQKIAVQEREKRRLEADFQRKRPDFSVSRERAGGAVSQRDIDVIIREFRGKISQELRQTKSRLDKELKGQKRKKGKVLEGDDDEGDDQDDVGKQAKKAFSMLEGLMKG